MERYTPQAKEALSLAVEMAESLNHGYVGTEHLLIGLLQEGTGVAAKVLEENGVEEAKVVELVSQLITPDNSVQMAENAAYTPRARRVIENSYREAVRFKAAQIGTEHILIAILREGDCVASRLLNTIGISVQKLYIDLLAAMGEDAPSVKKGDALQKSSAQNLVLDVCFSVKAVVYDGSEVNSLSHQLTRYLHGVAEVQENLNTPVSWMMPVYRHSAV